MLTKDVVSFEQPDPDTQIVTSPRSTLFAF